jgi:hypothetical protein
LKTVFFGEEFLSFKEFPPVFCHFLNYPLNGTAAHAGIVVLGKMVGQGECIQERDLILAA